MSGPMELSQTVKVDFSGFTKAAGDSKEIEQNLRNVTRSLREQRALAVIGGAVGGMGGGRGNGGKGNNQGGSGFFIQRANIYIQQANIVIQNAKMGGPAAAPRIDPKKDKEGGGNGQAALLATAAAASAFTWKAASLANPGAMERFNDAIADTTAVIGWQLIPVLESLTRHVREFGDWLANHPTATKGIAYGGAALAAVGTAGVLLNVAKSAASGLGWAGRGIGSLFGGGGTTATSADMAAGKVVVNGTEAAVSGSRLAGGARALGRLGPWLAAIDPLLTAVEFATTDRSSKALEGQFSSRTFAGSTGNPALDLLGHGFRAMKRNFSEEEFKEADRRIAKWNPFARGVDAEGNAKPDDQLEAAKKSSWGAAARPTQYTDILGSVMQMRQAISSSAGADPNERTADASERTATAIEEINRRQQSGAGPQQIIDAIGKRMGITPRGG